MDLQFCSISSGSKGNCYLVKAGEKIILIDAGISGKKIEEGLLQAGILANQVDAVLVTHEHSDHVKSIRMVCKKSEKAYIYANRATWEQIADENLAERHRVFNSGEPFAIGDIEIMPFRLHHDAVEPVGYSITYKGKKLSILTDTGYVCEEIYDEIKDTDLLVLEANHEVNVLKMCSYPYQVKMRILGDHGHLSNTAAADCIVRILQGRKKRLTVLLAHLSKENNTPEMAKITIRNGLEENGLLDINKVDVDVITQAKQSPLYTV